MKLAGARVVLTGAAGGIGREIARALTAAGAQVLLVGRDVAALRRCVQSVGLHADQVEVLACDVTVAAQRQRLLRVAADWRGGVDVLINNAGVSGFGALPDFTAERLEHVLSVNLMAPMHLCREFLPLLLTRREAAIVNVGSVLGAIGLPAHSVYTASKAGLRGFSDALRRELDGTAVRVHHLAPRATRTGFNSREVDAINGELGNAVDPPSAVAAALVRMLHTGRARHTLGAAERLFTKLDALVPSLVDRALRRQRPALLRGSSLAPGLHDPTFPVPSPQDSRSAPR